MTVGDLLAALPRYTDSRQVARMEKSRMTVGDQAALPRYTDSRLVARMELSRMKIGDPAALPGSRQVARM